MELLNEPDLAEFIRLLPDIGLDPPSVHLVMLAVRSRKAKQILGIKVKDLVVERRIVRPCNWWSKYYKTVYNLALLQHHGLYYYRGVEIPMEAKAIYATLAPRSVYHAVSDLLKESISYIFQGDESARYQLSKLDVRFFGCLHRHKLRSKHYVTLDLDNGDKHLLKQILDEVSILPIFMVTETSRGYHIVLDLSDPDDAKAFYGQERLMQKLVLKYAKLGLEIKRDPMEPAPGTLYFREDGSAHYVRILL